MKVAAAPSPASPAARPDGSEGKQEALALAEPSPASDAPLKGWQKAAKVRDLWNTILTDQPKAIADNRANAVLAAAFNLHGEDGLRDLLTWAHTQPWPSGRKKSKPIMQWMAKDHLAAVVQDRKNAGQSAAPAPPAPAPDRAYDWMREHEDRQAELRRYANGSK